MELDTVDTQELQDELAVYQKVVRTLKENSPAARRASYKGDEGTIRYIEEQQCHEAKLAHFQDIVSQYKAELAKR